MIHDLKQDQKKKSGIQHTGLPVTYFIPYKLQPSLQGNSPTPSSLMKLMLTSYWLVSKSASLVFSLPQCTSIFSLIMNQFSSTSI